MFAQIPSPTPLAPETNRTGTVTERILDGGMGWIEAVFSKCIEQLNNLERQGYGPGKLNNLVWLSPLLLFQSDPLTFVASGLVGTFVGVFSYNTTMKIFGHADAILSGGNVKNTNFKISLIFAFIVADRISPISIPSLPRVYAAGAGLLLGAKVSTRISDDQAKKLGQFCDKYILQTWYWNKQKPGSDQK